MKNIINRYFWILAVLFPLGLLAQVASNSIATVAEVPVSDVLQSLIAVIGGIKGASALGVSVLIVQLLMAFFGSSLADFAGKYKLLIVYGLSLGATFLASLVSGSSLMSALISGNVLAAAQVFGHQVYSQFFVKGN